MYKDFFKLTPLKIYEILQLSNYIWKPISDQKYRGETFWQRFSIILSSKVQSLASPSVANINFRIDSNILWRKTFHISEILKLFVTCWHHVSCNSNWSPPIYIIAVQGAWFLSSDSNTIVMIKQQLPKMHFRTHITMW